MPRCFVVQGFGKRQDYVQGKQFDLDASYEVIKEAIEDAGLECYRGDELRRAGIIDQVMYDELLAADLVVADITTFDPETLRLWAAVHKRLFEINAKVEDLEEALFSLGRGFFIKGDYYNGINLAYMLDSKAVLETPTIKEGLRAVARYTRRKVKAICEARLRDDNLVADEWYWVLATLYEACVGLGETSEEVKWKAASKEAATTDWMVASTETQVAKLRSLLD